MRARAPLLLLLLSCVCGLSAAYTYAPVTDAMRANAKAIINAALTHEQQSGPLVPRTWAYDKLAQLVDDFGPRFSGSDALESAINWVVATATAEGRYGELYNVTTEEVMIPNWRRGREYATLRTPTRTKALHMVGLGMSNNTGGKPISAPLFVVGSRDELLAKKELAKGKVILFNVPFTTYGKTVGVRFSAAKWAAEVGGVAALIRSVSPYSKQNVNTGASATAAVPSAAVSLEDANQMQRLFNRGVPMTVELYMEMHQLEDRPSRNVIIDMLGSSKPNEYVVFGGHIDSWDITEGASDDGGGIMSSWAAVHMLATLGIRPARTVRAVMWVNEENGHKGGIAYAEKHRSELEATSVAFESDEGAFSPYTFSFTGHEAAYNQLTLLKELVHELGAGNVTKGGGGTDIGPMCELGVPCGSLPPRDPRATDFSNNPCRDMLSSADYADKTLGSPNTIPDGYFWYHHTEADTMERMDPKQLQTYASVLAIWAAAIADLPELLPRTGPVPPLPPTSGSSFRGQVRASEERNIVA